MTPAVGIVLFLLVRYLLDKKARSSSAKRDGQRAGWHLLIWIFGAPILVVLPLAAVDHPWLLLPLSALLLVVFPWPIARHLLVPLGLGRLAYVLTQLSTYVWRDDARGGAALAGAWALLRRSKLDLAAAAWIERRIAKARPLRGASIVASGLLAAARGDRDGARSLLASVETLDGKATPPEAIKLAREWLAADAAARGAWDVTIEIAERPGPRSRTTRLLGTVAACLLGKGAPSSRSLWWRWAVAPHRRATLPLCRRALAAPPAAEVTLAPTRPVASTEDRLAQALDLHAALARRPPSRVTTEEICRLGDRWDAALADPAIRRHADERALVLNVLPGGDAAVDRLRDAVVTEIAGLARAADLCLAQVFLPETSVLRRAARSLRDQLLSEIELASEALYRRCTAERELPVVDEWREWNALRTTYERAVLLGGLELRRLAFPKVHHDACELAVWMWNKRGQRPFGNALFRWLLAEATAVGDTRLMELEAKNVRCGL